MATVIDVGNGIGSYDVVAALNSTYIDYNNAANATGIITQVQFNVLDVANNVYIGIFTKDTGAYFICNVWTGNLGNFSNPGTYTINNLNLPITAGEFIGISLDRTRHNELGMNNEGGGGVYCRADKPGVGVSSAYSFPSTNYTYGRLYIIGYGSTPPTLSGFIASENNSSQVNLSWTNIDATVTNLYRAGSYIYQAGSSETSYADSAAAAPVITPGSAIASDGASTAHVALSLSSTSISNGTSYTYWAIPFLLSNGTYIQGATYSDTGYRPASALYYQWQRYDTSAYVNIGSNTTTSTYNDTGAPAPTITGGTAAASDGTSTAHVALSISGQSANVGATKTYRCYLTATGAAATTSATNTGYRGVGALGYQWQRSWYDGDAGDGSSLAITDGGLEIWTDATHLTNWALGQDGTGGTLDREATEVKVGTYSAKVTVGTAGTYLAKGIGTTYNGKTISIGCWCKSANNIANRVLLLIYDTVGGSIVNIDYGYYQNSGGWEYLVATIPVDATNTNVGIQLRCSTGANAPAYFDVVSGVIGTATWDGANGLYTYSNLSGATSSTYNDTKIPYPERRYYRCYLTSSPATAVYSAVNSGYTAYIPRIIFL